MKVELTRSEIESIMLALACRNETLYDIMNALPEDSKRRNILIALQRSNISISNKLYNVLNKNN